MQPLAGQETLLSIQRNQKHLASNVLSSRVGVVSSGCGVVMYVLPRHRLLRHG